MTAPALTVDPGSMRALRVGTVTQVRRLASSPLASCGPGARLWVREACVLARLDAQGREEAAAPAAATRAVFADGWRQDRDGSGAPGASPTNPRLLWTPAIRMPRWAARAEVIVEAVAIAPLRSIDRAGLEAEGLRPVLGGLCWRWPYRERGLWRDPWRAFATMWDRGHATPGERWADDPAVAILDLRLVLDGGGD